MSSISISSGEGLSKSSRRPDSMRCHARGSSDLAIFRFRPPAVAERAMTVASHHMVIDQSASLHHRIDDGRAAEAEAALLEILRDRFGQRCRRRYVLAAAKPVLHRLVADKAP